MMGPEERAVVFFDGECVLCNGLVDAMLRFDRGRRFLYASLQGETADAERRRLASFPHGGDSIVLLVDDRVFTQSAAVFEIARRLPFPWRALSWGRLLPTFVTDAMYRFVARHRYRWFGRRDACRLPSPDEAQRLLA